MRKILIFGNSGSGKSTLAIQYRERENLAHLDLDTLAWRDTLPPARKPLEESAAELQQFIHSHPDWVIEGCYADLLGLAKDYASEMIFLDLPVEECIENARNRPWEPHKYPSPEAQDKNLEMLINWVRQYDERNDEFSRQSHQLLYDSFRGEKKRFTNNSYHQDFDQTTSPGKR